VGGLGILPESAGGERNRRRKKERKIGSKY